MLRKGKKNPEKTFFLHICPTTRCHPNNPREAQKTERIDKTITIEAKKRRNHDMNIKQNEIM
jgi:hypothetical protein